MPLDMSSRSSIDEHAHERLAGAVGVEEHPRRQAHVLIAVVDPQRRAAPAGVAEQVVQAEQHGAPRLLARRRRAAAIDDLVVVEVAQRPVGAQLEERLRGDVAVERDRVGRVGRDELGARQPRPGADFERDHPGSVPGILPACAR
ncbi:MAG: hypothetical protein KIT31_15855 [Deltaproteobacteria bacterium]|nr:hypothetical protein [Deltaproteobacteria bacterium]